MGWSLGLKKPGGCNGCTLERIGTGFARTDGLLRHGVLLVGEALGKDEVPAGLPFQGGAGRLLDRMVARTKDPDSGLPLARRDFLIGNVVNCRPPDNELVGAPYEDAAIAHCAPYLLETLKRHSPRVVLALGNTAFRWFTGEWGIDKLRGYVFDTPHGPVIGTYHPAYIMRGKFPLARVFQMDLLKALYVARHGVPRMEKRYTLHPTVVDLDAFYHAWSLAGRPILSFDIETPYSTGVKDEKDDDLTGNSLGVEDDPSYQTILRISLTFRPGEAITMPFTPPYDAWVRRILGEAPKVLVWNRAFDVPRLQYHGVVFNGRIYDGMDAWHFLEPSLPMGLKYAATFYCPDMGAWKLESRTNPEWYNAADSDVALRCYLGVRADLEKEGRWETFERHFVDLSQVLRDMSNRGVNVDRIVRAKIKKEFDDHYTVTTAGLQVHVPQKVRKMKVFKLGEATLRKKGSWDDTRMVLITREELLPVPKPPKPPREKKKRAPSGSSSSPKRRSKSTSAKDAEGMSPPSLPSSGEEMPLVKKEGTIGCT